MKLGLLADVHEHNDDLRMALDVFQQQQVDQVVMLGDILESGDRIEETCRLLSEAGAVGVWGNHDFGLCYDSVDRVRQKYSDSVLDFMARLRPRVEIDGCLFTHVEPWRDPNSIHDLWSFDALPDTPDNAARSFEAVPNRFMFIGHLHRWLIVTPAKVLDWRGEQPIRLDTEPRYLVLVAALCDGRYATFDTHVGELVPFNHRQCSGDQNG
ncbi:MAG: metallophosphoesterase family protein [Planctomycetes bacterium]|nr:metallophosphoesterase family protein [Planctomycetota bacterium]